MEKGNSRRSFLKKSATLIAASAIAKVGLANNRRAAPENGIFTLPALPYAYDALEPHIDMLTMSIHHSKHHQGYVNKLNNALGTIDASVLGGSMTFSSIFKNIAKLPRSVRNNAGGHYNHSLFWSSMKKGGGAAPTGSLGTAINKTFGSYAEFKKQFTKAAMTRFGSGWAWLIINKEGKLIITSTANQDNPLMQLDNIKDKGTPILALDVWEHAYYLKNQNRRGDYLASFWNVVNWETAEEIHTAATAE